MYLSAGVITKLSTNSSFSYLPLSHQTSFIFAQGIIILYGLTFETFVKYILTVSHFLAFNS